MAVSLEKLLPYVLPHVPGCPEFTAMDHLAEAAANFCKKSKVWRVDLEEDTTIAGEQDYEPDLPTGAILEDLLFLKLNGQDIGRASDRHEPPNSDQFQPNRFAIYQDRFIRFYPIPDATYTFHGVLVLKPSKAATTIEEFLYEEHGRVISFCALAKLMAIPRKEWTDLQGAADYKHMFLDGVTEARSRDSRKIKLRNKPHYF